MPLVYQPLAPAQIRLLTFSDDIGAKCTLQEHPLNNAPPHACLSYAWQDEEINQSPKAGHVLSINGQDHAIRSNLQIALAHLGPIARSKGFKFWVDAICINQDDVEERSEQVKLMKRIFEQAESVMAWVGTATPDTKLAVGLLHTLNNFPPASFHRHSSRAAFSMWQASLSRQPVFAERPKSEVLTAWASMVQMFKRVYWSRAWIHQEVTGPNVAFYCGQWSFTWTELHTFNKFHGTYGGLPEVPEQYMLMLSGGVNLGSPFFDLISAQENSTALLKSREGKQKLMVLIRELRLTSCSDARDKVFAALPHATDTGDPNVDNLLAVDYSKSVVGTFVDVARFYLQNADLDILGYIGEKCPDRDMRPPPTSNESPLPSWVPDWRIPYRIRPLNATGRITRDYSKLYQPLPNTIADVYISGSELHVRGLVFDTLLNIATTSGREHVPLQLRTLWGKKMKNWSPSLTNCDILRIFNADVQWSPKDVSHIRGEHIPWELLDHQPAEELKGVHRVWRRHMRHVLRSVCRDRRAGCTEASRIGIFPEAARPGDIVAAFFGGHALYVCRAISGRKHVHEFIGECYVDGMMDGQVLDLAEGKSLLATTLTFM